MYCRSQVKHDKIHKRGNRTPSRQFCPLPTVNMIHKLRGQDKNKSEKKKCSICKHTVKWPVLKAEVRDWVTNTETKKFCVYKTDYFLSKKMGGFTWHPQFCCEKLLVLWIHEEEWTVKQETIVRVFRETRYH